MKYMFVETRKKGREEGGAEGGEEVRKKKGREEGGRKGGKETGKNQKVNPVNEKNIVMGKNIQVMKDCCLDGIHLPSDFAGTSDSKESFPWCTIAVGTQTKYW